MFHTWSLPRLSVLRALSAGLPLHALAGWAQLSTRHCGRLATKCSLMGANLWKLRHFRKPLRLTLQNVDFTDKLRSVVWVTDLVWGGESAYRWEKGWEIFWRAIGGHANTLGLLIRDNKKCLDDGCYLNKLESNRNDRTQWQFIRNHSETRATVFLLKALTRNSRVRPMSRIDLTPADTTAMGVLPSSVRSALMSRPGQTSYRVMCKHEGSNSIGDENTNYAIGGKWDKRWYCDEKQKHTYCYGV